MPFLNEHDKNEIDKIISSSNLPIWVPLAGPQTDAKNCEADILFYGGAAGGGKGLLPDCPIATPFGLRPLENIRVGATVLAADGSHTKVIGVYPQKKQKVYAIAFSDGSSIVCDGPHKWNYSIARKMWRKSGREWKVATTEQLMEKIEKGCRVMIPTCDPLRFTKSYKQNMRVVDPYTLGLLLGDGYTAQSGSGAKWSFSTNDKQLVDDLPGEWVSEGGCDYRLRGPWRKTLMHEFGRLGLSGCKSFNKFVPEPYKFGTVEDRLALLQGLMDTDGTIDKDGKAYFTSTSKVLAEDVKWLVNSLGGRATITSKLPICTNSATGRKVCSRAYTAYIRMPDNGDLFRLERKRTRAKGRKVVKRRIVSIWPAGEAETICIAVDHPDSLFIAGKDLIVTHNTDLIIGLSLTEHTNSILFRREGTQHKGIIRRFTEIIGNSDGFNGKDRFWRIGNKIVDLGASPHLGDEEKHQGIPHDLVCFDEITHFLEYQFRFLTGWNRTTIKGQRCRVICTGNPPTDSDGEWVINFWGPWLDPDHKNPAKPGELRWYASLDGEDVPVESGDEFEYEGEFIRPLSRTFIPSLVTDNPYLMESGYMSILQAFPEPLRSQMLKGDFLAGIGSDPFQVIPSEWVRQSMARWTPEGRHATTMDSIGADIARGGKDFTEISRRHGVWFDELLSFPGSDTPDGPIAASLIFSAIRDKAPVHVDVIGVGASVYDHFKLIGGHCVPVDGRRTSDKTDRSKQLKFFNKRSELYWKMREALDPNFGQQVILPQDPGLRADLCCARWKLTARGIQVESKDELIKRIGRSPDKGDAVIYANENTPKAEQNKPRIHPGMSYGFNY